MEQVNHSSITAEKAREDSDVVDLSDAQRKQPWHLASGRRRRRRMQKEMRPHKKRSIDAWKGKVFPWEEDIVKHPDQRTLTGGKTRQQYGRSYLCLTFCVYVCVPVQICVCVCISICMYMLTCIPDYASVNAYCVCLYVSLSVGPMSVYKNLYSKGAQAYFLFHFLFLRLIFT